MNSAQRTAVNEDYHVVVLNGLTFFRSRLKKKENQPVPGKSDFSFAHVAKSLAVNSVAKETPRFAF